MSKQPWKIDDAHSGIQFTVRHMVVAKVRGQFRRWTADLAIDEADLTASSVVVSIDAASADTGNPQRDADLASERFFDAQKFPTLTFRSRRITVVQGSTYRVEGDLTIRDVTRTVTLEATLDGFVVDPWGARRAGLSATLSVRRSEFGMVWNQVLEAGGIAVGDEVDIAIDIEAIAPAAKRASASNDQPQHP